MLVTIPGFGVLRSAEGDSPRYKLNLNSVGLDFEPQDVLPSGEKAAVAVWTAVLREEVSLDGKQLEALVQFILEGL